jgi:uncharacterized protein
VSLLPWLLVPVGLVVLSGLALSFYLTHRYRRKLVHTAAEYGLDGEEITFPTPDGLRLQGVWVPADGSARAVVVMHGHGGSLDYDLHRAPFLHAAGFNVLLFDFRAHGRSPGRLATFGYLERRDVQGAVAFLKERGMRRIGLMGFSYGGMAAMLAAPLCPEVGAVISDGGPARLRNAAAGLAVELGLPRWLGRFLGWLAVATTSVRLGVNLFQYEPVGWVGKIAPRPVLFVHGELDPYLADFDELYAAAGEPKEAWRVADVGHVKAGDTYPDEFRRRVLEFFERALPA